MKCFHFAILIPSLLFFRASAQVAGVEHVIIIGVDGMAPFGIAAADTPVMDALMKRGAYTMHARAVMPTSSSPNWASLIMGAGPEQHGVTSNEWQPNKHDIEPVAKGPGGIFPTIFSVLREQRPAAHIGVIHHWDGFGRLLERGTVNFIENPKTEDITAQHAADYIRKHKPTFLFVHLDHVDHTGHEIGWRTPEYNAAVAKADALIGQIIGALDASGISDKTVVLITADHGGKNKGHGGNTMDELEIPWIIAGPGVAQGKEISTPVDTYQTAATVAYVLGLKPPSAWIARPVLDAFVGH